jgi:cytochrome c553
MQSANPDDPSCVTGQGDAPQDTYRIIQRRFTMNPVTSRLRLAIGLPLVLASFYAAAQTTSAEPPAGRLLASNCFQCHGYNGKSSIGFEKLAGKSANEIYGEMKEMQRDNPPEMMEMHSKGYTDAQLRLISTYLSKQK